MNPPDTLVCPELEGALWKLYRDFFDVAEHKRRWRVRDDIPWDQCNPNLDPAIADVVETFCCVELYLPDYVGKVLPLVRHSKGRTWFYANWGYEESKHSLALSDWLCARDIAPKNIWPIWRRRSSTREWNLPHDCHLGMLAYAMVQEHATFLNYRNLRQRIADQGGRPGARQDPRIRQRGRAGPLRPVQAPFSICFSSWIATVDRGTAPVLNQFQMPAIHDLLDESAKRIARVRDLEIFNEEIFFRDVYSFLTQSLDISRSEMRGQRTKKSLVS